MKHIPPSKDLYNKNRANFIKKIDSHSIAIFNANDLMPTNADGLMPFKQNSDLLYLSGIDQEETILVLIPNHPVIHQRELLFIKKTSDLIAIWEGYKLTKEKARNLSGIQSVYWISEFEKIVHPLVLEAQHIYLNNNESTRAVLEVETREDRFSKWCRSKYPTHHYQRAAPILHQLRSVKDNQEVNMIQQACNITEAGFRRTLKYLKPGIKEFEVEAEFIHEFIKRRATGFAYQPIIASGENACILHYVDNNKTCNAGDLVLLDVGAEYGHYNADMTRTIPVNGTYTDRQKAVYNAVLNVQKSAINMLEVGVILNDFNKEVGLIMEKELVGLKLLDSTDIKNQDVNNPAYKKYFMHGTSHFLGLDVHDVGSFYKPIKEDMVFTVEPGIYIREENLGIRLEDNILIKKGKNINLMENIPIEIDEIETLMNEK